MEPLAELDRFNLDPEVKLQLSTLMSSLLQQSHAQLAEKTSLLEQSANIIAEKETKIAALSHELAYYKRIRFGQKTEALAGLQRDLFREDVETDLAAIEAELDALKATPRATVAAPRSPRRGRQPLPEHLPRIEHRHEPANCTCGQCGGKLSHIRDDITEQLDVEPAKFYIHRHIRPQYACRACETVIAETVPPAIIDGGLAAVGLLAWVVIGKYLDHSPLYRLEQIAGRSGVNLSRSTLADWVGQVGVALQPLVDRLIWHLLQGNTLHADETPMPQLAPGNGKTKKAYLWAYRSNDLQPGPRMIVFDYRSGRNGQHARDFLGDWRGCLMVDDYAGYKPLFTEVSGGKVCTELACFAHVRRKFFDLFKANQSPMAYAALEQIADLYEIESQAKNLSIEQRQLVRQDKAKPLLEELHTWLQDTLAKTAPGGASAKALNYALKRWPALIRYADTGHLPIDNNACENTIRPIAIGRKNYLFVGTERAGKRAAAIQSLLGTAKLNGLDPAAWLKETLEKLPTWPNSKIDELLPFGHNETANTTKNFREYG
ncbi:MAG: IS66 family transposase [Methylococcaceae bacterium]|nr:IS66 family transposase [Methylococcaceae bacterium]